MGTLPRLHHEHNASVGLTATEFTCSGRPEQVVEFLDGAGRRPPGPVRSIGA
ncbi:hypothetical protein [Kitasatospora sp. NPDC059817]|uniref:hypothetical protein n=1 Tax=Kitasatospora sp. NPDC059817 TaxID=3346961 RepID=UPI00365E4240